MSTPAEIRAGKKYRRTAPGKYSTIKRKCKYRSIPFNITLSEYIEIVRQGTCHYCGDPLPEAGIGVDRLNSNLGYVKGNLVPSCYSCNTQKGFLEGAGLSVARVLELMKELKDNGIRLRKTIGSKPWAVALLFLLSVTAFAAPRKASYTFDPQSIIKVEVDSHVCKMQGTTGHCKHAVITFGAGKVVQASSSAGPSAHLAPGFVNRHADNTVTYTFKPAECKPEPARKNSADALLGIRYSCKNVSWQ